MIGSSVIGQYRGFTTGWCGFKSIIGCKNDMTDEEEHVQPIHKSVLKRWTAAMKMDSNTKRMRYYRNSIARNADFCCWLYIILSILI